MFLLGEGVIVSIWQQIVAIFYPGESLDKLGYTQKFVTLAFRCFEKTHLQLFFLKNTKDYKDLSGTLKEENYWLNAFTNNGETRSFIFDQEGMIQLEFLADSRYTANDDAGESIYNLQIVPVPMTILQQQFLELASGEVAPFRIYQLTQEIEPGYYIMRFSFIEDTLSQDFSQLNMETRFTIKGPQHLKLEISNQIENYTDASKKKIFNIVDRLTKDAQYDIFTVSSPGHKREIQYGLKYISGITNFASFPWPPEKSLAYNPIFVEFFTPRDSSFLIQATVRYPSSAGICSLANEFFAFPSAFPRP